ncbi:MAG TPA: HAD family hydrolase [Candidatus Sulfomarinibacteraceae bacterium]|nr:HAD family hydrolase [Candidatus Sulfomarinibacteraceae bacterium]
MRLILFDIDGTLIRSNRAGRAALVYALENLFGTAGPIDHYQMAGKTDPLIITELLQAAGLDVRDVEERLEQVYELMAERGQILFPQTGIRPCPGVPELLQALQQRDGVVLGLVTGNNHLTAPLKLAAAGIDPGRFVAGAYGSDDSDRNLLPALAMERAGRRLGYRFSGHSTVVVGDTPADILCAHASKATAVAIATGSHAADTLARYNPDYLLDNLMDTKTVLEIFVEGRSELERERK